ncbi:MAG TPA: RagB/SusD family nutrient uptake outer membrane protein, partial [Bacteroidales bacterium]|nr:RagB/SusD family nutrient uptake outer membrane protein [Bacteroidales bacterium]
MKIMNKNIIILLLVIIGSSCTDFLDEKPKDRLTEINFYETFADAQAAVNAIYGPIRNNYRDTYFLMLDLLADYLEGRGSTSPVSEYKGFDVTNINRAAAAWRYLYQTIRNANIAIERIPKIEGMKESDKNALIAEASFLRAFSYYFLVRLWGAVPLYLDLSPVDLSRRPVSEVYQAIINDLKTGETYLPDTPSEFGHPTKWSAKSLLAEVYLTINEFDLSKDKAGEVITSGHFNLVDVNVANDFNNVYGPEANGTPEEIFYIKFNHTAGWTMPHKYLW